MLYKETMHLQILIISGKVSIKTKKQRNRNEKRYHNLQTKPKKKT